MTTRKDAQIRSLKRQLRKALTREWGWRDRAVAAELNLDIAEDQLNDLGYFKHQEIERIWWH